MSRGLGLELITSLIHAAAGYIAAFIPLALRRILAACLVWDPHPTIVWLLGSAVLGLLIIVGIGKRQAPITRISTVRLLGRILFGVPALPFGPFCLVMMAPHGILMLPHIWPLLCSLAVSIIVGLFMLRCSVCHDVK